MARKIELRTGCLLGNGANGAPVTFGWGDLMAGVLRYAPPNEGLVLDQVIRCVNAQKPLDQAIGEVAESVTFSEEQYATLIERLDRYPFPSADPAFAEFGLAIREAKEIT